MSAFSSYSLGTTQRARHVAVMMMAVRPETMPNCHLLSFSLDKPIACVNQSEATKNRYIDRVFCVLARIDFRR
jgi:hypothetical protein